MKYFKIICQLLLLLLFIQSLQAQTTGVENEPPNVILIITDDQGYGDLGFTGNPHVKTPVLDNLARQSTRLNDFYVSPVCAPTRSSLMTGRYSLRTGVRDTYNGGATMATEEITLAEMLKEAGYETGIFGKWHLGDNYPFRPGDQGFDQSLIHLAGGMGQPGDFTTFFKRDSSYFDPTLWYNGKQKSFQGYCSDIFTNEAIRFVEKQSKEKPFFLYLSFNAPHTPLQVPEGYYQQYKDIDPSAGFQDNGMPFPEMSEKDKEDARKVYAMVSNIDDNVGKLMQKLDDLGIADNTIIIFMTDNGPQQKRYVAGMRGRKGSVFRGGVRVPFFIKYPKGLKPNQEVNTTLAHIDVLPTLAELCQAKLPEDRVIDGISFAGLLKGEENKSVAFDQRPLFFYWSRKLPELYDNVAIQKGPYKLVGNTGYDALPSDFELFHLKNDPYELNNIVAIQRDKANELKNSMDQLVSELTASRHLQEEQRPIIGTAYENPLVLNRNDAGGQRGVWRQEEVYGLWNVEILEGTYTIRFKFIEPLENPGKMMLETGTQIIQKEFDQMPTDLIEMKNVAFKDFKGSIVPLFMGGGRNIFPLWVAFEKVN
jgi:arylsulfatase